MDIYYGNRAFFGPINVHPNSINVLMYFEYELKSYSGIFLFFIKRKNMKQHIKTVQYRSTEEYHLNNG